MKIKRSTVVKTVVGCADWCRFRGRKFYLFAADVIPPPLVCDGDTHTQKKRKMETVVIGVPVFSPT
jgi:hypothetical protein